MDPGTGPDHSAVHSVLHEINRRPVLHVSYNHARTPMPRGSGPQRCSRSIKCMGEWLGGAVHLGNETGPEIPFVIPKRPPNWEIQTLITLICVSRSIIKRRNNNYANLPANCIHCLVGWLVVVVLLISRSDKWAHGCC